MEKITRSIRCGILGAAALAVLLVTAMPTVPTVQAQGNPTPFSLPFNTPPGPGTWMLNQLFGNTPGAYNFGTYWYSAGQGLHFGVDFSAPCQTPIVAVADGIVDQVDNFSFGLEPHNLTLVHRDLGYTSVYGHLYTKPTVKHGQAVQRGDVIALSGDPDRTCVSRPHLHLEIRSMNYSTSYDPVPLIDADWPMLTSMGCCRPAAYTKDLDHPERWQTPFDQPDVHFNQNILNKYLAAWPPANRYQPPPQTLPAFTAPPVTNGSPVFRALVKPGCCSLAWWSADSHSVRYWDGPDGQRAAVMSVDLQGGSPQPADSGPVVSPDGQSEVRWDNGRVSIVHLADHSARTLVTGGAWPRFSPGSSRLLWQWNAGDNVPGALPPQSEIWTANPDGSNLLLIEKQTGISVFWLDDDRILVSHRQTGTNIWDLSIITFSTRTMSALYKAANLRGIAVAPGGKNILYQLVFQQDPAANGMFVLNTQPGAVPVKLPFWGSARWRDSTNLIYIPYEPGKPMRFVLYDVVSGQSRTLTDPNGHPFRMLDDDWSISPDGRNIAFWNYTDLALTLITLPG